jgi:hypothetical protein
VNWAQLGQIVVVLGYIAVFVYLIRWKPPGGRRSAH